jgi:hypothetical protein
VNVLVGWRLRSLKYDTIISMADDGSWMGFLPYQQVLQVVGVWVRCFTYKLNLHSNTIVRALRLLVYLLFKERSEWKIIRCNLVFFILFAKN